MTGLRLSGWATLLSGIAGLFCFVFLILALSAPPPEAGTLRRESSWFLWQDWALIAQSLLLLPMIISMGKTNSHDRKIGLASRVGITGQLLVVLTTVLIFPGVTADMLYMAPMGLVGWWLLLVRRGPDVQSSRGQRILGLAAGIGLLSICAGFLVYAALVEPRIILRPLTTVELDAATWTPANILAHVGMAIGTLIGRSTYPIWTVLAGLSLL